MSSLSSSFSLNLELHDNHNQSSFSNRSIHEIWSPNPSPKGSYPSTPSEDSIPYFSSSHENRESPYHNRSPVDILAGRHNGSPMLTSPCSVPSDQSFLQHHPRKENSPFYGSGFTSIDSYNNNHVISNGIENNHAAEHGQIQRQNMHAIRALQFIDPNSDQPQNGKEFDGREGVSPTHIDEGTRHDIKGKKHQVHFEEKGKNGIIIKQRNGRITPTREDMMTAAKRLGSGLDECLDQLRNLEREYRKVCDLIFVLSYP